MFKLLVCILFLSQVASTVYPWPGQDEVSPVDYFNEFEENLSGLSYDSHLNGSDVLWAVQNSPSLLYKLHWNGTCWLSNNDNWKGGKKITYKDGKSHPDSEDVTLTSTHGELYICAEQNNDDKSDKSRLSILRYIDDPMTPTLRATHEWLLNDDLPQVDDNSGLEAITWIPDTFLVTNHFVDEHTQQLYDPTVYPNHGNGIFCVGLEENGDMYCYVLDHADEKYTRIARIDTGTFVMAMHFDEISGYLWAVCDDTCDGRSTIFTIQDGIFRTLSVLARPSSMPNINNEGFTISSRCINGYQDVYWSDDSATNGYSIRQDSAPCGAFLDDTI